MKPGRLLLSTISVASLLLLQGWIPHETVCVEEMALESMRTLAWGLQRFQYRYQAYPLLLGDIYPEFIYDTPFLDPWGEPFYYKRNEHGNGYELFSMGRDRAPRTLDDVVPHGPNLFCSGHSPEMGTYPIADWKMTQCVRACRYVSSLTEELTYYHRSTGTYPEILQELNNRMSDGVYLGAPSMFIDSWGMPYVYSKVGSRYELYSLGPDGIPDTADDVDPYCEACGGFPSVSPPEVPNIDDRYLALSASSSYCEIARARMYLLDAYIQKYRGYYDRLPDSLADIDKSDNVKLARRFIDPWGQEYQYQRLPAQLISPAPADQGFPRHNLGFRDRSRLGYLLSSNGADQLPNTDDDLVAGFPAEKCWQHPYDELTFQQVQAAQERSDSEQGVPSDDSAICCPSAVAEKFLSEPPKSSWWGCSFTRY